ERRVAAEQWQLHCDRIARIHGYIRHVLTGPHKGNCCRKTLSRREEIRCYQKRQQYLKTRTHEYMNKLAKENKDHVARCVKDKIRRVDKVPLARRQHAKEEIQTRDCCSYQTTRIEFHTRMIYSAYQIRPL